MAAQFPTSLPGLKTNYVDNSDDILADNQNQPNLELNALAAKVGIDASGVTTSHDYKLSDITGSDKSVGKSATQTLTNKTLTSPIIKAFDGWNLVSDSWTYASASTITVPSGAAALYQKGDKLKLNNTTTKYFVITAVADTVLTVTGGDDYTVDNAAISAIYVSHQDNPLGFPATFAWTPVFSGASGSAGTYAATTNTARFTIKGQYCFVWFCSTITNKGSWSGVIYMTTPVDMNTLLNSDNIFFDCCIVAFSGNPDTQSKGKGVMSSSQTPDKISWVKQMGNAQTLWADVAVNDAVIGNFCYPI